MGSYNNSGKKVAKIKNVISTILLCKFAVLSHVKKKNALEIGLYMCVCFSIFRYNYVVVVSNLSLAAAAAVVVARVKNPTYPIAFFLFAWVSVSFFFSPPRIANAARARSSTFQFTYFLTTTITDSRTTCITIIIIYNNKNNNAVAANTRSSSRVVVGGGVFFPAFSFPPSSGVGSTALARPPVTPRALPHP